MAVQAAAERADVAEEHPGDADPAQHPLLVHQGDWTLEDLERLPDDGRKYEVVDGSLLVVSGPRPPHALVVGALIEVLRPAARAAGLALLAEVALPYRATVRVPDLAVVTRAAALRHSPPPTDDVVLAVEVQSPGTATTDQVTKHHEYAEVGIEHYWRVVPGDGPLVVVHRLAGGIYDVVAEARGDEELHVDQPFDVALRPADLLQP